MSIANEAEISPEEMLRLPKEEQGELVDGRIVEKSMNMRSSWIGTNLCRIVGNYVDEHDSGWVFGSDMGIRAFPREPDQIRVPDMSFIEKGRISEAELDHGYSPIVPDWVVEVTSPNDRFEQTEQKINEYLEAGTPLIWLINPGLRIARIYRHGDERPEIYHENDVLSADPILPGFELKLKDIFPASAEE